jgi:hypothetical protein
VTARHFNTGADGGGDGDGDDDGCGFKIDEPSDVSVKFFVFFECFDFDFVFDDDTLTQRPSTNDSSMRRRTSAIAGNDGDDDDDDAEDDDAGFSIETTNVSARFKPTARRTAR